MSTYYDFFAEAKFDGQWHNIDYRTLGYDGKLHHQFLVSCSRSFLGRLSALVEQAGVLNFEDLSAGSQQFMLEVDDEQYEDCVRLSKYYTAGTLAQLEAKLSAPYEFEGYITRNQLSAAEQGEIDDFEEFLSAKELLDLPEDARREYVLQKWDYPFCSRAMLQRLVDKLKEQLEYFNDSIPYQKASSGGERRATEVRILYRIS